MINCQLDGKCICIPEKLIRQIIKQKRIVQDLDLQGMQIQHLQNLNVLRNTLQELYLAKNRIQDLGEISHFTQIRLLDLTANDLVTMRQITNLQLLEELKVGFNQIKIFDLPIYTLPSLVSLDISYNQLQSEQDIYESLKDQQVQTLFLQGNYFKNYMSNMQKIRSLIILDGKPLKNIDLKESQELRRIISIQENQISKNLSEPEILQKWRMALFKEMVNRKELQILQKNSLQSIRNVFLQNQDKLNKQCTRSITDLGQRITNNRKTIQNVLNVLKSKHQKSKVTLQKISYSLQSLTGQTEFTARVDESQILNYVRILKSTLDELKRQKQEVFLTCDIYKQEQLYVKEQLQNTQNEFLSYKKDAEKLENLYKNQDYEKNRIINDLKNEIKQLQEEKLQIVLQKKEDKNSDELEVFSVKQRYEQDIQSLKYDLQILQQKFKTQADEFRNRSERAQQKFEERLMEQEHEFTQYYNEVKQEYDFKLAAKKKLEEKQSSEIVQLKQQVSQLQVKLQQIEFEKEQESIARIQEKSLQETTYNNSLQEIRNQMDKRFSEYARKMEEEKQLAMQEIIQKYEKDKTDLFRIQEDQNQNQIEELQQYIDEEKQQKKKLSQQNLDLTKIIELKDEMIRQLQINNAELKSQQKKSTLQREEEKLQQQQIQQIPYTPQEQKYQYQQQKEPWRYGQKDENFSQKIEPQQTSTQKFSTLKQSSAQKPKTLYQQTLGITAEAERRALEILSEDSD